MNTSLRTLLLPTALLALTCTTAAHAQVEHLPPSVAKPMPSPPATASTTLDGKTVTINYNAPSLRGRKMIGDHEPYGKVWRTGANPATTLITAADLQIGALTLPAGTYTVFSIPEAPGTPWQLIISKDIGEWGLAYKPEKDLGRTPMMSKPVASPQEVMSITFENVHGKSAELHIRWADADEYVKVEAR